MTDAGFPIIVPSPEVVAAVHHAPVPDSVPDELVPFVRPSLARGRRVVDWLLTDDTLAFADVSVPLRFAHWRSTWERSWILDPLSSLERLVAAAREFEVSAPSRTLLDRVLDPGTTGPGGDLVHASLDPDEATRLAAVVESLRDAVADRGRSGFGFIDATPGRRRTGLARAWSGQDGPETLVADHQVSVTIDADAGLSVVTGAGNDATRLDGVDEVEIRDDRVEIRSPSGAKSLDLHVGRVLSWLMPGCAVWRVRPVPEVLVWARTFAGLVDSAELARSLDRPVLLTSLKLSESDSIAPATVAEPPRRLESRTDQEQ